MNQRLARFRIALFLGNITATRFAMSNGLLVSYVLRVIKGKREKDGRTPRSEGILKLVDAYIETQYRLHRDLLKLEGE